jgi:GT2 family glycosyltransferase
MLAFIDSDCLAQADWLSRLHLALEEGYDGVGGSISNANGHSLVSWAGYMCEFREFLPGIEPVDVQNLTLNNVAYRRAAFWSLGGFPEGFFPQEDQVFHHIACEKGLRLQLDPRIAVAHNHRTEVGKFLSHQRYIGRANAQVLRKLNLPGAWVARRPVLAVLALPALVLLRFIRTVLGCRKVEQGLILRRPYLLWLCWLGMCGWGIGFVESARSPKAWPVPLNPLR